MQRNLIAAVLALAPVVSAATWTIDSVHSGAQFSVRHMMVSNVRGSFSKISGTVDYDPANPANAKVDATIDVNSINTNEPKRDGHLKSPDFFDAEKFPTMRFVSKRAMPASPGKLKLLGDLTIHGVTKEVTFDVDGPSPALKEQNGGFRTGASATTKINRKDFGLTWSRALETGGAVVGDEVNLTMDVELTRK
ncbi:MAG: polyisoprenoid-binding protein [Bryobacteraceae bacterium]|nr:polyisoprenoid-binding protein [Bryobacteraceae bacterium]